MSKDFFKEHRSQVEYVEVIKLWTNHTYH
jgi:hypothetical protein